MTESTVEVDFQDLAEPYRRELLAYATSRESIRLALITALQHLPSRQRAVLIMRDVLSWRAAEVAELLGTSTVAVNRVAVFFDPTLFRRFGLPDVITGGS